MTVTLQLPPIIVSSLIFLRASAYSSVSASALFMWDWLLSFQDEVDLIWSSKTSFINFLFIFNRYFNMFCRHVDSVLYLVKKPSLEL
ncbi:hypothetical protein PM082_013835 [Marasmius tenuissimus]|nr:hypothetical protein PM082_013835 [Marasmius tenuissimus]